MMYQRGYKIFEPLNPMNPNPLLDNLVMTLIEGSNYLPSDLSISFEETLLSSSRLNGGLTEYRYFVAFDDENIGNPSNVFSLLNLMPPTNINITSTEYDELKVSFSEAEFAHRYRYSLTDLNTMGITQGIIVNNGTIGDLTASTNYELKLASLNEQNESTEWSSVVQKKTLTLFKLTTNISSKNIIFTWTHDDHQNVEKYDLINVSNNQVLYSGLDRSLNMASPTTRYVTKVVAHYNNGSNRNTREVSSVVFSSFSDIVNFSQLKTINSRTLFNMRLNIFHDLMNTITYKNSYSIDYLRLVTKNNLLYSNYNELGFYRLSLINNRHDNHDFRQGSTTDGDGLVTSKTETFQDVSQELPIKSTINNYLSDRYVLNNRFFRDYKLTPPIKLGFLNEHKRNILSRTTTIQNDKTIADARFYIENSRTTPYGLKLEWYNFMSSLVTRTRQQVYNPITPFDIDHIDVIFNLAIRNIDLESQINKVRILCLGDSITAGAPSYDPQYGGTVWMPDLITGKTKTRNVIESQYPYWLQLRLGLDDFEVINEGSGRRTTPDVLHHARRQMQEYKPEYVIVMIGTNDIFSAQDSGVANLQNVVSTALNNIRQTVEVIIEHGGTPILGTQMPRNSIVPLEAKNAIRSLNAGIKGLGIEYMIDIIDWYDEFVQKDSNGIENGVLRYDLTVDDTHPSVHGYRTMAYTINLGIFNSFRASIRLFSDMKGEDVDYSKEEARVQPDPYTFHYSIKYPELRRLQRYVFSKYLKNTGNSWGLYVIQLEDMEDICDIWDANKREWVKRLSGQLAPNQVMELRMRYVLPAVGTKKEVDFKIDYIVKR